MNIIRSAACVVVTITALAFASSASAAGGIVFMKSDGIWFMNVDGTGQRRLVAASNARSPHLAKDVVVYIANGSLYRTNTSGATPQLISAGGSVLEMALKPDGTRIAFTYAGATANFALQTMSVDGGSRTTINTAANLHQTTFHWGRDGYIYVVQAPYGNPYAQYVARIPENGYNNPQQLVTYFSQQPAEGGTDGKIAFLYNQPAPRLRLMNRNGTSQSDVPSSPSGVYDVAFDYDENVLYYSIGSQIHRVNTNGTQDVLLASGVSDGTFGYGTVQGQSNGSPQDTSSLRITGGTLAGQSLSSNYPSISVSPGASITGSFTAAIVSTFPSNAVMSIGVTPSWGNPSSSYTDLGHFSTPTSNQPLTVPVSYSAPSTPGTYYIVTAFNGEFNAAQVLSCTNWSYGSTVWNDGNDVAAWTARQMAAAISEGRAPGYLRYSDGMKPMNIPAAVIVVTVSGGAPPAAPTNLSASATSSSAIRLSWADNSNNEFEFRIEQKSGNTFMDIGAASANQTSVNVTGLSAGFTATFRIRARGVSGDSPYSNEATATTPGGFEGCIASSTTVCLLSNRFRVSIAYVNPFSNPPNQPGTFLAARLLQGVQNPDTALFGFSSPQAVEVVVRVQDARPFAQRFDIYYGGLTDVGYTVTVTDTQTGNTRQYTNSVGTVGGSVDRSSFPAN